MGAAMVSSDKSGWGLAGDMLKGVFVGVASGAAGAWAGGVVAGSITAGGFINGSLSGLAGGFSSGFVGCSGNAWLSGAGFGVGLKAGLIGGGLAAAFGGVSGGLIRGFTDMAKGYSFWDGSIISNFIIGLVEQQSGYKVNAKSYNNSGTYVGGGRNMGAAFSMYKTAIRLNNWGYYPDGYTIPKFLRYSW